MQTTSDIAESVNKEFWANYRQILHTPRSPHVEAKPIEGGVHWERPKLCVVLPCGCKSVCLHTSAELWGAV